MSDPNPFVLVHNALWTMAERSASLMSLVRVGNRIKYDSPIDPKFNVEDGDLPELALVATGVDSNIMNSSSSSAVWRRYAWEISTGAWEINPYYHNVCWELYRAMIDWDVVLCSLEWPLDSGWYFVVKAQVINADEGKYMRDQNRSISGWAGIWTIEIEMHFSTENLRLA